MHESHVAVCVKDWMPEYHTAEVSLTLNYFIVLLKFKFSNWIFLIVKGQNWASWQNQQNGMCIQRRYRSAWASVQSNQSSQSAWRKLGSLATERTAKTLIRLGRLPRLIWFFAGCISLVLSWDSSISLFSTLLQLQFFTAMTEHYYCVRHAKGLLLCMI